MERRFRTLFCLLSHLLILLLTVEAPLLAMDNGGNFETEVKGSAPVQTVSPQGEEPPITTAGKWVKTKSGRLFWVVLINDKPIVFTPAQYHALLKGKLIPPSEAQHFRLSQVTYGDVKGGNLDYDIFKSLAFWKTESLFQLKQMLKPRNLMDRTVAKTHKPTTIIGKRLKANPEWASAQGRKNKLNLSLEETFSGNWLWRWREGPYTTTGKVAYLGKEGGALAAESVKMSLSPGSLALTFGLTTAMELGRQILAGERPNAAKVVKIVTSAHFIGGFAGSVVGAAAGSFVAPALTTIPIVGGALSAFAPAMGAVAGSMFGSEFGGSRDWKKAFKAIDFYKVVGQGIGSVIGAGVGFAFGPIGGIVGSMVGGAIGSFAGSGIKKLVGFIKNKLGRKKIDQAPIIANPGGRVAQPLTAEETDGDSVETNGGAPGDPEATVRREVRENGEGLAMDQSNAINQELYKELLSLQGKYRAEVQAQDPQAATTLRQIQELKNRMR